MASATQARASNAHVHMNSDQEVWLGTVGKAFAHLYRMGPLYRTPSHVTLGGNSISFTPGTVGSRA